MISYDADIEQRRFEQAQKAITKNSSLLYAGSILQYAAQQFGDNIALIYHDTTISFIHLYRRACMVARQLKERGVAPGDRVIISFENTPDFYVVYFAVWQVGAVVVPVNTFLKKHELRHIVADAQPVLICTTDQRSALFEEVAVAVMIFSFEQEESDYAGDKEIFDEPIVSQDQEALCALLYTSGTTGLPKGVMLSSKALITNVLQVIARLALTGVGHRIFAVLPLFHVFAQNTCVWAPMLTGCAVILVEKIDRRLIMNALRHKPTFFLGVPALYGMLCLLKTAPLESVQYFISGGDALPDKISGAFSLIYRRKICNGYGLTETSPVIAVDMEGHLSPTGNVGRPLVGVTVSIRDPQGNEVPQGVIGELWVAGPQVMMGYYHEPVLTDQVLKDGFFSTGDLCYRDTNQTIVITGRLKDVIISKGFNIYPAEIENLLLSHHNVIGAAVVGKKDDQAGEVPIAWVQLRTPEAAMPQLLRALCLERLATYKIPHQFLCTTESLPTTATGKIDKKIVRERVNEVNK